jgi:hypothetical protein
MALELQSVKLALENDTDGRLVFADGRLIALLSKLSDQHAENAGRWYLEYGIGKLGFQEANFADLEEASRWIENTIAA